MDWRGYQARCARGVELCAELCGLAPARERARLAFVTEKLGRAPPPAAGDHPVNLVTQLVGAELPLTFELVLTYAGQGPRGMAYLTQGRPGSNFPATLATLLAGALELHVAAGGDPAESELFADLFALAFPGLARLGEHSPHTQGMIVGVVPAGEGVQLKIYFNTRVDPSTPHAARVSAMLARCGLEDNGLYDLLYGQMPEAWFQGVGVDLDNDQRRRAKLYVRLPPQSVPAALGRLAEHLGAQGLANPARAVEEPVERLLATLRSPAMADELELAAAIGEGEPTTAKLTLFFGSREVSAEDEARLVGYLDELGYPTAALARIFATLGAPAAPPLPAKSPLHGVGIEVPVGARPKVNLYLMPVV